MKHDATPLRPSTPVPQPSWLGGWIRFCLENKFVVVLALIAVAVWGIMSAPFDWKIGGLPRNPIPVDAIPDIGENQQIVFTEWMGRSPQDVEDQISYPLTVSLLGVPGVKTIRSYSMFGFSTVYIIFKDDVDFYWSRSRVLEKLNSLPSASLPEDVQPTLGPDATALGQIFWYTLEGLDENGRPTGGWDLDELRTIQDWYVRYALLSAEGISEVASVGGVVREYQVDVDPDAMRAHGVKLNDVFKAVKMSNVDVGARSIEINQVEYFIRGLGFLKKVDDIEKTVIKVSDHVPIYVKDVAHVSLGPALRRGALDKEGAEAVGGVVVVRYGENPLAAIQRVKQKIEEIAEGLPEKAVIDFSKTTRSELTTFAADHGFAAYRNGAIDQESWLAWLNTTPAENRPAWITHSKVNVVPFYDRTGLIYETLGTLNTAIRQEIMITVIVVLVMVRHLTGSVLISGLLPLAVLMTFIAMRLFHVDANIVALSGIAIAIGTMVDMGVVICENILRRLDERGSDDTGSKRSQLQVIYEATTEVGSAVLTAVATTVVGFLPVLALEAAEGKLFKPLAYTKTFALIASIIVALTLIPPFAHLFFKEKKKGHDGAWPSRPVPRYWRATLRRGLGGIKRCFIWLIVLLIVLLLSKDWRPLGLEKGMGANVLFVGLLIGGLLLFTSLFQRAYPTILRWALAHKRTFLGLPALLVFFGGMVWLGFDTCFGWLPQRIKTSASVSSIAHTFPGLGKEFMPSLDEGSYLFMPTTMPHASMGEALDVLQKQDMAMLSIPEIDSVVGKLGRAETPLDPAPISMFETVIHYKPQYLVDRNGKPLRFKCDTGGTDFVRDPEGNRLLAPDGEPYKVRGRFVRDEHEQLIPDSKGVPFRLWRPALDSSLNANRTAWAGIQKPDDIWDQILKAVDMPGTTSAPKLQPIAARIVMLQSGMRAPMGVKVKGPDLDTIEKVGLQIERFLKEVPSVEPAAVLADRIVGKPYLEIDIDREAIARYGLHVRQVQDVIEVAIGGKNLTTTVEGRERYPVRVRYPRELRDQVETLGRIVVPAPDGAQIPLAELAKIRYLRGPQVIKSEETFLIGYVVFDKKPGTAEVDVVEQCREYLKEKIDSGALNLPAGVSYTFSGSYENQIRATKKLAVVVPVALLIVFIILYLQFRSVMTSLMIFTGILVAWAGGIIMIWLYAQPWFLDINLLGTNMRELFQIHPINLSVAIWVGFLALFGIASDNGVIVTTVLDQLFGSREVQSIDDIHRCTIAGAQRRIRPALMTSATTILALIPVLTSTGRGASIMVPMAIPSFGGMAVALITVFVVPVFYCALKEFRFRKEKKI